VLNIVEIGEEKGGEMGKERGGRGERGKTG
jgi:hypothetical protein